MAKGPGRSAGSGHPVLLVLGSEGRRLRTIALPHRGVVSMGRAEDNFVRLADATVSRRHANLHVGDGMFVEDLGSDNGTWVLSPPSSDARAGDATEKTAGSGHRLARGERAEIGYGSVVKLGAQTLVVARAESSGPRRLWSHVHLMGRLEQACAQAERGAAGPSLVRVKTSAENHRAAVDRLLVLASEEDLAASPAPGEIELLVAADHARANELALRLEAELGVPAQVGVAHCPENGKSAHALVTHSAAAVGSQEPAPVVIVEDPAMRELWSMLTRVAASPMPVLVLGETGVGKEIIAEAVHRASPRARAPFFCLNCGALGEALLESELFGHEKSALTRARGQKRGLLEAAHGGTILLDEIGELPAPLQLRLLRVIEERQLLRVGSVRPTSIDVRFVAATERELEHEVALGRFRSDLYVRIAAVTLRIPPLRERPGEIEPLARQFLAEACKAAGRWPEPELSPAALKRLRAHAWPGNVSELKNVIEGALWLCAEDLIEPSHLPLEQMQAELGLMKAPVPTLAPPPVESSDDEYERTLQALEACAGNQTRAAKLLGISRRELLARLKEYELPRPRKS